MRENFGAELKKNGSTDPVKFIFNDSRRIYYGKDGSVVVAITGRAAAEEGEDGARRGEAEAQRRRIRRGDGKTAAVNVARA